MYMSSRMSTILRSGFFFFNDTATTEIYTLSLHDALPIFGPGERQPEAERRGAAHEAHARSRRTTDRKSTRLNSSHDQSSYAVFCLKKKAISSGMARLSVLPTSP